MRSEEIKELENKIEKVYGDKINLRDFVLLKTGNKERIWIINKEIVTIPLKELRISSMGLYFGRIDRGKIRLSIEGAMMINPKKNWAEIDDWKEFVRGFNVECKCHECEENQYVIVKWNGLTLGIAKYHNGELENIIPKGRKIKKL